MEVVLSDSFYVLSLLLYAKPSYIDKSDSHSAVGKNYCAVGCPLLDCILVFLILISLEIFGKPSHKVYLVLHFYRSKLAIDEKFNIR